jgi:hypothetical protein
MAGKSSRGIAGYRIGIRLSHRLLGALLRSRRDQTYLSSSAHLAMRVAEEGLLAQSSPLWVSADQIRPAQAVGHNCADEAFYPDQSPTVMQFRSYSFFGGTVPPRWPKAEDDGYSPMSAKNHNPDATSREPAVLPEPLQDPVRRRSWLLAKALESHSLDQALKLARAAEAFIIGSSSSETAAPSPTPFEEADTQPKANRERKPPRQSAGLALSPEAREPAGAPGSRCAKRRGCQPVRAVEAASAGDQDGLGARNCPASK